MRDGQHHIAYVAFSPLVISWVVSPSAASYTDLKQQGWARSAGKSSEEQSPHKVTTGSAKRTAVLPSVVCCSAGS